MNRLPAIAICLLALSGAQVTTAAPAEWPFAREAASAPAQAAPPRYTDAAPSQPRRPPPNIHPAVVRIVAPGNGSISFGSGTLVFVGDKYGLVITNWHVINEATGPISVHFPDGFYSLATVQKADRDWDLAILSIGRPNAQPVPLAKSAPRPGELLTIAGYGSGDYRAATGVCTQYVAPGTTFPFEMVEVAVSARQGDSGGPIFNSRGELAGVLFGEGNGRTSGSYCGRVQWFLASVVPDAAGSVGQIAVAPLAPVSPRPSNQDRPAEPSFVATLDREKQSAADEVAPVLSAGSNAGKRVTTVASASDAPTAVLASTRATEHPAPATHVLGWTDLAGETLGEQIKTVMAAVGVLAVILQILKWMSTEPAKT